MKELLDRGGKYLWCSLLLIGTIGLSGCLSEIELDTPDGNNENLAIRARVVAGDMPYVSVSISKLSNFRAFDTPEPVIGASVILLDDQNNAVDIPMREDGLYELDIPENTFRLEIIEGMAYQLSVATAEGENYLSSFETLLPVPDPTAIETSTIEREVLNESGNLVNQEFIRFLITTPLIGFNYSGRAYLKWNFLGTYKFLESNVDSPFVPQTKTCYFFQDLNLENVVVYNGSENSNDTLSAYFLLEEVLDYRFADGFYLTVFQQSLNEGAYRYWDKVQKVVDLSGNFFEAPPGKVVGNFINVNDETEEVFGYFYATEEKLIRFYIPPGAEPIARFCPLLVAPADDSVSPVCYDCLSRKGSTIIKPDFWEE